MAKRYEIFVEFFETLGKANAVRQTLGVTSAGPEFNLLLQALHASPAVASLTVFNRAQGITPRRLTHEDLGYELDEMKKLK